MVEQLKVILLLIIQNKGKKYDRYWQQQLYIKGRKLRAFTLWVNLTVNEMTPEEAADNWDLPLAAIHETIEYCEANQSLLKQEAEEECRRLEAFMSPP